MWRSRPTRDAVRAVNGRMHRGYYGGRGGAVRRWFLAPCWWPGRERPALGSLDGMRRSVHGELRCLYHDHHHDHRPFDCGRMIHRSFSTLPSGHRRSGTVTAVVKEDNVSNEVLSSTNDTTTSSPIIEAPITTKQEIKKQQKEEGEGEGSYPTTTVEEQYSRKSPVEHVLLRPGMYVGPNERLPPTPYWVLEPPFTPPPTTTITTDAGEDTATATTTTTTTTNTFQDAKFVQRELAIVPALIKVFDEILVNSSDNRLRHPKSCLRIDVTIDPGGDTVPPKIRVWNNGPGIPIHMHATEQMYVPELVFGHLLTGSNFNDDEKRITGGRHGYGAKLANIFSHVFTIETVDMSKLLKYRQTWRDNMSIAEPPVITAIPKKEKKNMKDYTCVEFVPDLVKLTGDAHCVALPDPDYAVMCRRVIDVAGCAAGKCQVTLNGTNVSFDSFADYCQLYRHEKAASTPLLFVKINPRWTMGVGLSESGSFESVSFVNGMATTRGGTHVNALVQQITKYILEVLEKKHKELAEFITVALIKRNLFVCVDTQIENATFDSQMKEYLTSSPDTFGSSCTISAAFLKKLMQSAEDGGPGILEHLLLSAKGRQHAGIMKSVGGKKTRRQLLSIPKLEDAHRAGKSDDEVCTLILTEGDSAKSLAVAGLEVLGRDHFGVYPLRGKLLNVRDVAIKKLVDNNEIKAMLTIIGLQFDREYGSIEERRELRYQRVMIMTDQDTDGSHIKGLVINFFRCFWPKLLLPPVDVPPEQSRSDPPFLASFVTPLLKATKKGKKKNETIAFYSVAEYNSWRNELESTALKGWTIKYYKGLGTSTPAEAKEYFSAFINNLRPFRWKSDSDGEMLDMVFDKKRAADRRDWILDKYHVEAAIVVNPDEGNSISYEDFVNKEMIHYSHADNIRSIPSVVDGLKPSQRKVLYACFKRNLKSEIKVAQLSGYCAEHTAYHHGEMSLQSTIVGMAQDFVGSNNVNLLVPSGQFGTRLAGGSDAASARYIFTHPSTITRLIFPEADEVLLSYCEDDGQKIEPKYYCPIIPMLLVNGSQGIGTGWSCNIPSFHPIDVLNYIRAKLDNKPTPPKIDPFARGFIGTIQKRPSSDGFTTIGRVTKKNDKTIVIDELPLGSWTSQYKEFLVGLQENGDISNFFEGHTTTKVLFTITVKPAQMEKLEGNFESKFKLTSSLLTTNMHAFDANCVIRKYNTPEEIADDYFGIRMKLYEDRKSVMESEMKYLALLARNKATFIQAVTSNDIDLTSGKKSKLETVEKMEHLGFSTATYLKSVRNDNEPFRRRKLVADTIDAEAGEIGAEDNYGEGVLNEYDYLLNMPLSSLTTEKVLALREEAELKDKEFEITRATSPSDLWRQDLDKLESPLRAFIES